MFFVLFFLWMIFNARITLDVVVLGLVLSAVLNAFGRKVCHWNTKADRLGYHLTPRVVRYAARLFVEIVQSNFAVLKIILSPSLREVQPRLFFFDTKLQSEVAKLALANSITITPGTYTVGIYDTTFAVHALNKTFEEGALDSTFNKQLRKMESVAAQEGTK